MHERVTRRSLLFTASSVVDLARSSATNESARESAFAETTAGAQETGEADCNQVFQQGEKPSWVFNAATTFSPDLVTGNAPITPPMAPRIAPSIPLIASNPVKQAPQRPP